MLPIRSMVDQLRSFVKSDHEFRAEPYHEYVLSLGQSRSNCCSARDTVHSMQPCCNDHCSATAEESKRHRRLKLATAVVASFACYELFSRPRYQALCFIHNSSPPNCFTKSLTMSSRSPSAIQEGLTLSIKNGCNVYLKGGLSSTSSCFATTAVNCFSKRHAILRASKRMSGSTWSRVSNAGQRCLSKAGRNRAVLWRAPTPTSGPSRMTISTIRLLISRGDHSISPWLIGGRLLADRG